MNEEQIINGNGSDLISDIADGSAVCASANGRDLVVHEVAFYGDQVDIIERDCELYVAMKPICERMGLNWDAQRQLIQRDPVLSSTACMIHAVGGDGKSREMTCLPLNKLNGWLFKLDVSRYEGEQRELLIRYQSECYDALHQHFMIRPRQVAVMARQEELVQNQLHEITAILTRSFDAWRSLEGKVTAIQERLDPELPVARVAHPLGAVRMFLVDEKPMVLAIDFLVIHRRTGSLGTAGTLLMQLGFSRGRDFEVYTASEIGMRYGAAQGDVMTKAGLSSNVKNLTLITPTGMAHVQNINPGFYDWYIEHVGPELGRLFKIAHRCQAQTEVRDA